MENQSNVEKNQEAPMSALARHNKVAGKMEVMREEMRKMTGELLDMKEAVFAEFEGKSMEERMKMFDSMPDSEVAFQLFHKFKEEVNEIIRNEYNFE